MTRRVRTYWLLRERYQRLALCAAVAGGLAALAYVAFVVDEAGVLATLASPRFLLVSALLFASCVLLPRWAVRAFGRRHSRRHE